MFSEIRHTLKYFSKDNEIEIEAYDFYYIAYSKNPISREKRKLLKEHGWILRSRSNKEIWIYKRGFLGKLGRTCLGNFRLRKDAEGIEQDL